MNALVVGCPGHPSSHKRLMSPSAVFCMDPVTLLQNTEIPATQHIFEQNYVSCICFASCQNLFFFLFSPNGALALGKGAGVRAGEWRAAADLPGLGDGDDTRQPVVSRLPTQIHLQLAANKSLHLMPVHCPWGDERVGLGVWHHASLGTAEGPRTSLVELTPPWGMQCSSRGGLGQEEFKIILMMPLNVATGDEVAESVVSVAGPGRAPSSAAEPVGSTETQFFMCSAWRSKFEDSLHAGN